ncbi:MAG: hypothetical protein IJD04_02855 [Desulfovibrionaceae bacterium]|nr:hypothetical protein [Desulfovibrionaceae bacterium]
MQNFYPKVFLMLMLAFALPCLGGCALLELLSEKNTRLDTGDAFSECLKLCYDTQPRNAYSACLDGCGRAANHYPLRNELFSEFEKCADELDEQKQSSSPRWGAALCKDISPLSRQQGCREGVRIFNSALTADNACLPLDNRENKLLAPPSSTDEKNASGGGIHTEDLND